jgi:hypothetical protein
VRAFSKGRLEPARVRQIGFGEATSSPLLVERTKAEVAGGLPLLLPLLPAAADGADAASWQTLNPKP